MKTKCSCGKDLEPVFNDQGEQIGVSHLNVEDEDWHNKYWSTVEVENRIKSN